MGPAQRCEHTGKTSHSGPLFLSELASAMGSWYTSWVFRVPAVRGPSRCRARRALMGTEEP